ncbi:hypothetical protein GCL60_06635 [Silvanigrella paludirubra]|uniref:Uncharacterized protein n=1 Tax=Silvanigrella paludirubra TaxID=2499159 RepID=A0A6N6VUR3_9BACT|nr:hypothetical protein [Silvanigrella paludirubra]KAB8039933.1 hypothetical protein GCL60_06635 [Silvanigrella paludirubra]
MKKMIPFFVFTLLCFVGCGKSSNESVNQNKNSSDVKDEIVVDSEFLIYLKNLKEKLLKLNINPSQIEKINNVSLILHKNDSSNEVNSFSRDSSKDILGVCKKNTLNNEVTSRKIFIDRSKWELLDEEKRLNLIAHELGHCAWNLKHLDTNNQIMSPHVTDLSENEWAYFAQQIKESNS